MLLAVLVALTGLGCSSSSAPVVEAPASQPDGVVALIDGETVTLNTFKDNFERNGRVSESDSVSLADYEDFLSRFVDLSLK